MPPPLANLALWLDGSQPANSNAVPYGRVSSIPQPAPLSGNWTSSGVNRPWKEDNALDFRFGEPSKLTQPASVSIPSNDCTIAIAWHHRIGQTNITPFSVGTSGAVFGIYITSGAVYLAQSNGTIALVPSLPVPVIVAGHLTAKCTLIIHCTATQYEIRLTVNGVLYIGNVVSAPLAGALGTIVLGPWQAGPPGPNMHMAVSQFAAYSHALDVTQTGNLQAWLLSNLPGDPPISGSLVMFAGDSICAAWTPYWTSAVDSAVSNPPRCLNSAVAGGHTSPPSEQPTWFTTDVQPYYSSFRSKNILLMEGISVNDVSVFFSLGQTPAQAAASTLAGYYAYLDNAKANGWTVISCTMSPNTAGANMDLARDIINASIRANALKHSAYLCDLGAAPGMSTPADAHNTALFYDGTHLTEAGYVIWNSVMMPVLIQALISSRDPYSPPPGYRIPTIPYGGKYLPAQIGPMKALLKAS